MIPTALEYLESAGTSEIIQSTNFRAYEGKEDETMRYPQTPRKGELPRVRIRVLFSGGFKHADIPPSLEPVPSPHWSYHPIRNYLLWQDLLLHGLDPTMPTAPETSAKRQRRSHVKSRNGCVECKTKHRKVTTTNPRHLKLGLR